MLCHRYRDQRDRPDLTLPESLQLYLETRFEQLKVACDLEMWQEAFRSVEDIHGLMQYGKKSPKPQMMAMYYAKLTQIFAVSGSNLYHAYAWYKLHNLSKQYNKNLTTSDLQMMSCSVLLSALSILPYERKDSLSDTTLEKERTVRMATILGFAVVSPLPGFFSLCKSAASFLHFPPPWSGVGASKSRVFALPASPCRISSDI